MCGLYTRKINLKPLFSLFSTYSNTPPQAEAYMPYAPSLLQMYSI